MLPTLDLSCDLTLSADGLESVTLHRQGCRATTPGTIVPHAFRLGLTTREAAASDGRYTASDVVWHLSTIELPTSPRLGDVICDDAGRRWTVLDVARTTLGSRWRCTSRSLAIVHGLDDTITVLKAHYSKGEGGAMEPTWLPSKTGIRARIQPVAWRYDTRHQVRETTVRCRIYVEEPLGLDHSHRIQASDGTIYKILGTTAAETIGELETIEAEVTPWP
jgi:hypothetical protein